MIDGQSYPYSPSMAGAQKARAPLDDAVAAVRDATAPRQWHPGDLEAATKRAIARKKQKHFPMSKGLIWLKFHALQVRQGPVEN
jgi:hypothetical protein